MRIEVDLASSPLRSGRRHSRAGVHGDCIDLQIRALFPGRRQQLIDRQALPRVWINRIQFAVCPALDLAFIGKDDTGYGHHYHYQCGDYARSQVCPEYGFSYGHRLTGTEWCSTASPARAIPAISTSVPGSGYSISVFSPGRQRRAIRVIRAGRARHATGPVLCNIPVAHRDTFLFRTMVVQAMFMAIFGGGSGGF